MKTVWLAINKEDFDIKVHKFAETARNTVFEWVKNDFLEANAELPETERFSEKLLMEEANEEVIHAEEAPWLSRYLIIEMEVED